jgi:hypothetical protein
VDGSDGVLGSDQREPFPVFSLAGLPARHIAPSINYSISHVPSAPHRRIKGGQFLAKWLCTYLGVHTTRRTAANHSYISYY